MSCNISCSLALVFLIGKVYLLLSPMLDKDYEEFNKSLDKDKLETYKKIIEERSLLSIKGYILGITLSVIFLIINGHFIKRKINININIKGLVCIVGGITSITHYLFYMIHPKSDYMILYLDKKEQRKEWLDIYRKMQLKFHIGFVCGIIAAMLMCYGINK